jgi:Family of unknown function (DUF6349)
MPTATHQPTTATANDPAPAAADKADETLCEILEAHRAHYAVWEAERTEASRRAMRARWEIHITCPGSPMGGIAGPTEVFTHCTPTVLSRDTRGDDVDDDGDLYYRGACLHCGWVSAAVHPMRVRGENGAAEDANDHAFPGWREMPIVAPLPHDGGGTPHTKAVAAWRQRWEPSLPSGWLDRGGPIRTLRARCATRHVPGRAPGGGYDMSAGVNGGGQTTEVPGGQLALFA